MIMLVKFHNRGKGVGAGPIDYLLGKDRNRELASVLRGDPEQTKELIDSLNFAKKYTSGVLTFEESDLPESKKQELMNELERHLLAGLDANQYDCLWVEHRDKGRLELNFVIPNVELTTSKRLQPYYDRVDRVRNDAFQTYMNGKHGLSDPNDPAKTRSMSYSSDLPTDRKEIAEHITTALINLIATGVVKDRDDIVKSLNSNGFNVVRNTKKSLSIRIPGDSRNTRLSGDIYEQSFRASPSFSEENRASIERYRKNYTQRVSKARKLYESEIDKKQKYNRERYKPTEFRSIKSVNNALERVQNSIKEIPKQNNVDLQYGGDTRCINGNRVTSTGLEISNNQINSRLNQYERDSKTIDAHDSDFREVEQKAKPSIRGTSEQISRALNTIGETFERYGNAAIKLDKLHREQRIESKPSFRPRF
jgi:hypothetical protein